MPQVDIFRVTQRTEDSQISIYTPIQNPLMVLDLLLTVQKQVLAQAGETMELKPQIIKPESPILT